MGDELNRPFYTNNSSKYIKMISFCTENCRDNKLFHVKILLLTLKYIKLFFFVPNCRDNKLFPMTASYKNASNDDLRHYLTRRTALNNSKRTGGAHVKYYESNHERHLPTGD